MTAKEDLEKRTAKSIADILTARGYENVCAPVTLKKVPRADAFDGEVRMFVTYRIGSGSPGTVQYREDFRREVPVSGCASREDAARALVEKVRAMPIGNDVATERASRERGEAARYRRMADASDAKAVLYEAFAARQRAYPRVEAALRYAGITAVSEREAAAWAEGAGQEAVDYIAPLDALAAIMSLSGDHEDVTTESTSRGEERIVSFSWGDVVDAGAAPLVISEGAGSYMPNSQTQFVNIVWETCSEELRRRAPSPAERFGYVCLREALMRIALLTPPTPGAARGA